MAQEKVKKFMECDSLEDFKKKYVVFHKQRKALEDGFSYWDVKTSNMDGTPIGEEFDNEIRIKALKDNNQEYLNQSDIEELDRLVEEEYKKDKEEYENDGN